MESSQLGFHSLQSTIETSQDFRRIRRGRRRTEAMMTGRAAVIMKVNTLGNGCVDKAKHLGPIHLLLTDVAMPQMSGPEVAEKLAVVRPEIKVLYMSGYPDHPVFEQGGVKRDTAFLQKPFTPNVLTQKVRDVLDAREADA